MNGSIIQHILANSPFTAEYYKGFCTFDLELPVKFSTPSIFILNTDRWYGEGEHWCVANFLSDGICEFYDSYGKPPCYYNFDSLLYARAADIIFNPICLQGSKPTCGHHCLFYILHRYYGYSPWQITHELLMPEERSQDLALNDNTVYQYILTNYGKMYATFI